MYRQRFGLKDHVFPQDAHGATFFETPSYKRLKRKFMLLAEQPGLGVADSDAGVGKSSAMRNLTMSLPRPDYKVIYLCDTSVSSVEMYRQIAREVGLTPTHRRGQLWHDLKKCFMKMVDEQNTKPVIIIDEAQNLSDPFLSDLSSFLNFAMDSRNLLTLWLVGQPYLRSLLRMNSYTALESRVAAYAHLEPITDRDLFAAFLAHGMKAAGATSVPFADSAVELIFRTSRGIPRRASRLVREVLIAAHERNKDFVDELIVESILDEQETA